MTDPQVPQTPEQLRLEVVRAKLRNELAVARIVIHEDLQGRLDPQITHVLRIIESCESILAIR